MPYLSDSERKRFWAKIDVKEEDDCWEWQAAKCNGYGSFSVSGLTMFSHRVVILDSIGMKKRNNIIMHTCDNPVYCNPKHLIEGTRSDNIQDMYNKNRQNSKGGCKLNEECIKVIRFMLKKDSSATMFKKLAKLHKIHIQTIRNIHKNKTWAHVTI